MSKVYQAFLVEDTEAFLVSVFHVQTLLFSFINSLFLIHVEYCQMFINGIYCFMVSNTCNKLEICWVLMWVKKNCLVIFREDNLSGDITYTSDKEQLHFFLLHIHVWGVEYQWKSLHNKTYLRMWGKHHFYNKNYFVGYTSLINK